MVYCRLLLEYLSDKQAAIHEMLRVTKPGGTVLLQDLDGQLIWNYPVESETEALMDTALTALAKTGFDPLVGRKLFPMLQHAGASEIEVDIRPYHQIIGSIAEPEVSGH